MYESVLDAFESEVSSLKEMWEQTLVTEAAKEKIKQNLAGKATKAGMLVDRLQSEIEMEKQELDYFEGVLNILEENSAIGGQYHDVLQQLSGIMKVNATKLEEAKSQFNKQRLLWEDYSYQSNDPITLTADFEHLSDLASNLS